LAIPSYQGFSRCPFLDSINWLSAPTSLIPWVPWSFSTSDSSLLQFPLDVILLIFDNSRYLVARALDLEALFSLPQGALFSSEPSPPSDSRDLKVLLAVEGVFLSLSYKRPLPF